MGLKFIFLVIFYVNNKSNSRALVYYDFITCIYSHARTKIHSKIYSSYR
jgi:hypothetical protein